MAFCACVFSRPTLCSIQPSSVGSVAKKLPAFRVRPQHRLRPCYVNATEPQATVEAVTEVPTQTSRSAVRKYFTSLGWDRQWVELIGDKLFRMSRGVKPDLNSLTEVVEYLTSIGIPIQHVCNMAAITHDILLCDVETQLKPVVAYLERRGVEGNALVKLLETNPKLLTFFVSYDRTRLEKARARAQVDVLPIKGVPQAIVSFWREGASFKTSPVAPIAPLES